jgi:hypothetical protein
MEDDKEGDASSHSFVPLQLPGGLALSDSEKAEALAASLDAQFQPANDPSDPAFIDMVDEAMRAYVYAPASEPKLTSPSETMSHACARLRPQLAFLVGWLLLRLRDASKGQTSQVSRIANTVGRNSTVPRGDSTNTADLGSTQEPGRKKGS